jgi:hypothetical protein
MSPIKNVVQLVAARYAVVAENQSVGLKLLGVMRHLGAVAEKKHRYKRSECF